MDSIEPHAGSFLHLLLLLIFALELASVNRSFLGMDVLLRVLEEFGISSRKHLIQGVSESGAARLRFMAAMAVGSLRSLSSKVAALKRATKSYNDSPSCCLMEKRLSKVHGTLRLVPKYAMKSCSNCSNEWMLLD